METFIIADCSADFIQKFGFWQFLGNFGACHINGIFLEKMRLSQCSKHEEICTIFVQDNYTEKLQRNIIQNKYALSFKPHPLKLPKFPGNWKFAYKFRSQHGYFIEMTR